ncbi:MAG: tyrosine-type recombinase/integrase [Propionibacteriaceae bacterium]|nr:tyrosine-type recombinase/integrase [Propionibacteriaceae bacterium]
MDTIPLDALIARFRDYQASRNFADGTRERYRNSFLLFDRFLAAEGLEPTSAVLTTATMEAFARWLRDTPVKPHHGTTQRAESGVHAHLRDLRAFTRYLTKAGLLDRVIDYPMPKIPKRLFRVLTDEELQRLMQSRYLTGNGALSIRNRALIALMLDTGLRREEVASLTLDSLNMDQRRLTVVGKGNKERQMVFSPTVRDHLKAFLAIRGVDDEPLFHLTAAGIRTVFRRIQQETGLEKFHPHQLRHQFATTMLREGIKLEVIGVMLGHEDYNTTRRYLSLDDSDIAAAHAKVSPFERLIARDAQATDMPRRRHRYSAKQPA